MIYVKIQNGYAVGVVTSEEANNFWAMFQRSNGNASAERIETRSDWKSLDQAEQVAGQLNIMCKPKEYIATDSGPNVSPRYDVIEMPQVGDEVSYAFNGDSYPCGKIVAISDSKRVITTSDGKKFWRRRQTGSWVNNGTWSLVSGHHYEQNPSF